MFYVFAMVIVMSLAYFIFGVMWHHPQIGSNARRFGRAFLVLYLVGGGGSTVLGIVRQHVGLRSSLIRILGFLAMLYVPFGLGLLAGWSMRKDAGRAESGANEI